MQSQQPMSRECVLPSSCHLTSDQDDIAVMKVLVDAPKIDDIAISMSAGRSAAANARSEPTLKSVYSRLRPIPPPQAHPNTPVPINDRRGDVEQDIHSGASARGQPRTATVHRVQRDETSRTSQPGKLPQHRSKTCINETSHSAEPEQGTHQECSFLVQYSARHQNAESLPITDRAVQARHRISALA